MSARNSTPSSAASWCARVNWSPSFYYYCERALFVSTYEVKKRGCPSLTTETQTKKSDHVLFTNTTHTLTARLLFVSGPSEQVKNDLCPRRHLLFAIKWWKSRPLRQLHCTLLSELVIFINSGGHTFFALPFSSRCLSNSRGVRLINAHSLVNVFSHSALSSLVGVQEKCLSSY